VSSSSGITPETPGSPQHRDETSDENSALKQSFASALEQILTAAEQTSRPPGDPVWAQLVQVAAKHAKMEFCMDPVLTELTGVITRQFHGLTDSQREVMTRAVAATLAGDQNSLVRLQHLWVEIQKVVAHAE
jgi:copper homeostasis protein CutC